MEEKTSAPWFTDMINRTNTLAEQFGLDDSQTKLLRDYVYTITHEHFRRGSKSGAGWAFKQARGEIQSAPSAS